MTKVYMSWGEVTDATSTSSPRVRLYPDAGSAPTPNLSKGYTPVNGHKVKVLVLDDTRVGFWRVGP